MLAPITRAVHNINKVIRAVRIKSVQIKADKIVAKSASEL